jgi:tetratricopeptide (TPR) repeat protein
MTKRGFLKRVFRAFFLASGALCLLQACAAPLKEYEAKERADSLEIKARAMDAYKRRDYNSALSGLYEALRMDRAMDLRRDEVIDMINIGRVLILAGNAGEAGRLLKDAPQKAEPLGDDALLSEVYATLAKASLLDSNIEEAKGSIERSVELDSKAGAEDGAHLNLMAVVYASGGMASLSQTTVERALRINTARGDRVEIANSLRISGTLKMKGKDYEGAFSAYKEAYDIDFEDNDAEKMGLDLFSMAEARLAGAGPKEATALFDRSFVVRKNSGDIRGAVQSLDSLIGALRSIDVDSKGYEDERDILIKALERKGSRGNGED